MVKKPFRPPVRKIGPLRVKIGTAKLLSLLLALFGILAGCEDASVAPGNPIPLRVRPILTGLTISSGTLSPAFDSLILAYNVAVPYETDSLILRPYLPASTDLSAEVNGIAVRSGAASNAIALAPGGTDIAVVVKSKSDSDRIYTIRVERAGSPSLEGVVNRRIYLNDRAAGDSLAPALIRTGVKFVLQPGKTYRLSLATAHSRDSLDLFHNEGDRYAFFRTVTAVGDGSHQVYTLASNQSVPKFFAARLASSGSPRLPGGIGRISLTSDSAARADTLELRLIFVRKLKGLPDPLSKADFAGRLFEAIGGIFAPAGIVIKGSFEIAEADSPPLIFPFDRPSLSLPGMRLPDCAHLYLVDSITVHNPGTGIVGTVLGFAPREGVDLAEDAESRVLLANPFTLGMTLSVLAVTAAHELGHLLGLRHTVSTRYDRIQDSDESNFEDGFLDTKFCAFEEALAKTGSGQSGIGSPGIRFCLRTRGNPCSTAGCDLNNLMYPVDCGVPGQSLLSKEQSDFLQRNLAIYRR